MKLMTRVLAGAGLLALNGLLAQRLAAATRFEDKGHCNVSAGTCVIPCDYTNHFCICTTNSECKIGEE